MKLNKEQLSQLIRESIKDQLSQLKEKSSANKIAEARSIIGILETQAKALDELCKHTDKLFTETQYSELTSQKGVLEQMRDKKYAKIDEIKKKYGILDDDKKKKKKPVAKKKVAPKKKPLAEPKAKVKPSFVAPKNESATGKGSINSIKAKIKANNKKK